MQFILLTILGFAGTEAFSYIVHRWLFHGILWKLHRTHHLPRKGSFELNDLFSVIFASVSIILMVVSTSPLLESTTFPVGLGIAVYGFLYFIIHDLFTHRRFLPFGSRNRVMLWIRRAHQSHHQSVEKAGREPFGLFLFDYPRFRERSERKAS